MDLPLILEGFQRGYKVIVLYVIINLLRELLRSRTEE